MDDPATAWREGQLAGRAGRPRGDNPHPAQGARALDWADGWLHGTKDHAWAEAKAHAQGEGPAGSAER